MPPTQPPLSRLIDAAADALAAVRIGRSLDDALDRTPAGIRPGTQALAFHALRHLGSAQALRERLADRAPPPPLEALLLVAIALLAPDDGAAMYADHTVVDQAVAACRQRAPAASGFVNAVLRRLLREREPLLAAVRQQPVAAWQHPAWWIDRVRLDWPAHWQALLRAANHRAPMALRVNRRRIDAAAYVQKLAQAGLQATAAGGPAVVLHDPRPVDALPGFAQGEVSVQDLSAQRAAPLLLGGGATGVPALAAGSRVLDACAAPGGKTAHLLELAELDLLALDASAPRLSRVRENLARLGLKAETRAGDARTPGAWWDGRPFDAILLDAPCTASGIVRRHPDIRWLRRPDDVAALAGTQAALLDALWPLLKPGGRLLFATCSLFKAEGQDRIDAFLQRGGPAPARLDPASPGHLLPLPDNPGHGAAASADGAAGPEPAAVGDGFFYALLHSPTA